MANRVILFWSTVNEGETLEEWQNRPIELSPFHALTLLSHVELGNEVYLFTYQNIQTSKVPKGITLANADKVYPAKYAFKALQRGHSIAHVSDAVRLKIASAVNGIVLDMDAVALKPFPDEDGFFSSMPAKMTGGFAPKWGDAHPPITVHDGSWNGKALCSFPIKVNPRISERIDLLSNEIMNTLAREPKTDSKSWNFVLWTVKDIIKLDSESRVYEPVYFCPVPSWLRAGKCYSLEVPTRLDGHTQLFGYSLPSIEDIFEKSFIVQHFFESAFSDADISEADFWDKVPDGSLLQLEAESILGAYWRDKIEAYLNE